MIELNRIVLDMNGTFVTVRQGQSEHLLDLYYVEVLGAPFEVHSFAGSRQGTMRRFLRIVEALQMLAEEGCRFKDGGNADR